MLRVEIRRDRSLMKNIHTLLSLFGFKVLVLISDVMFAGCGFICEYPAARKIIAAILSHENGF